MNSSINLSVESNRKTWEKSVENKKRSLPQNCSNAENFYYLKQITNKTLVTIFFVDGEQLNGYVRWYDKNCIGLYDKNGCSRILFKHSIKNIKKMPVQHTKAQPIK